MQRQDRAEDEDRRAGARHPSRLPRRHRAFYLREDAALRALGLDRQSLPIFTPIPPLRREDFF